MGAFGGRASFTEPSIQALRRPDGCCWPRALDGSSTWHRYADRSAGSGPPAAFFDLGRGAGEQRSVYVPDDGRLPFPPLRWCCSSRRAPTSGSTAPPERSPTWTPPSRRLLEDWGAVPEPFPQALSFGPATLRSVVPVNQVQSIEGLDIALVALERGESRLLIATLGGATRATWGAGRDRRQRRRRAATGWRKIESQSDGNRLEGAFAWRQRSRGKARRLTLTIGTVRDEGGQRERLSGPCGVPDPGSRPRGPVSSEPPLGPRAAGAAGAVREPARGARPLPHRLPARPRPDPPHDLVPEAEAKTRCSWPRPVTATARG